MKMFCLYIFLDEKKQVYNKSHSHDHIYIFICIYLIKIEDMREKR
jgi:hypothetical protein